MSVTLIQNQSLTLRSLASEDAPLLAKWLSDPQVLEYYEGRDNPHDLTEVREKFYIEDEITRCIFTWDGIAIGYLQFYPVEVHWKKVYGYQPDERIWGMDLFIGETHYWNCGIGTILVRTVACYVQEKYQAKVIIDPETWNLRAIRVYEKAGFKKIKLLPQYELHEGKWQDSWLMEFGQSHANAKF
ncbi:MAG: GNAT family N-acetyltransferase [Spirulina sp.]